MEYTGYMYVAAQTATFFKTKSFTSAIITIVYCVVCMLQQFTILTNYHVTVLVFCEDLNLLYLHGIKLTNNNTHRKLVLSAIIHDVCSTVPMLKKAMTGWR